MGKKSENRLPPMVVLMFAFMFILAVTSAVIGVLVPEMQGDYNLTYDRIGYLGSAQNVGGFVVVLFGGMFADRFDKLKLIGMCVLLYTIGILFAGMIPPYVALLLLFFVIGAMSNMVTVLVSAYLSQAYREKVVAYLNISHGFYGIGSLVGPTYATVLFSLQLKWTVLYRTLGVTCGVFLILYVLLQRKIQRPEEAEGAERAEGAEEQGNYLTVLKNPKAVLLCVACFFYMGQQTALSTWLTSFSLERVTENGTLAGLVTSVYWLGITVGRFAQSAVPKRIDAVKCTVAGCLAGGCLLAVGLASGNIAVLTATTCLSGVCAGAAYPNMIGAMGKTLPTMTGAGASALCIAGTFGGIVFPWLAARVIGVSYLAGMMVCPASMFVTALLLWGFMGRSRS